MAIIKPCPVCDRQPKILNDNHVWTIYCKPIFQKPHLLIQTYGRSIYDQSEAIQEWNKKVDEYKGEKHGTKGENH